MRKVYVPASVSHWLLASSNDARSRTAICMVSVWLSPGFSSRVLAKAFSSWTGFCNCFRGAVTYTCATSLPLTLPVFLTVTETVTVLPLAFTTGLEKAKVV